MPEPNGDGAGQRNERLARWAEAATAVLSAGKRPNLGRALGLTAPINRYGQRLAIPVRLGNGITLRADHFWPATATGRPMPAATVLIRTPYFRQSSFDARALARQGFHVLVVSSRGRFGSSGTFDRPMLFEAEDGQWVVEWLRHQPFFNGELVTWGQSYLGYTQWALAVDPPPELKAMVVRIGPHRFVEAAYPGGSPAAGTMLYWAGMIHDQEQSTFARYLVDSAFGRRDALAAAIAERPLLDSYPIATQVRLPFFEEWITSPPTDPFWLLADESEALRRVSVPVLLQSGWFDLFLNYTLEQYTVLHERGVDVQLTIGPWAHTDPALMFGATFAEGVAWLREALGSGHRLREAPVRVAITGARTWRNLPAWPPPSSPTPFVLGAGGSLAPEDSALVDPGAPAFTGYTFDPTDPPPAVGGAGLTGSLGATDNRALESRPDVVTFTSELLTADLEIGGEVRAHMTASSSRPTADFFVRLTDVSPRTMADRRGVSINVCDGIRRLTPDSDGGLDGEGRWRFAVSLGHIAHRFRAGHRIRVQVSSGAAPRYQPNVGVLEPPATASVAFRAEQKVWHDADARSVIVLPVIEEWPSATR